MEIKKIMCEMFDDGVYSAAILWDRAAAQNVIDNTESYYRDNPSNVFEGLVPNHNGYTYEQVLARGLHDKLYKVALDAWCRSYSRDQMTQLLDLLQIGGMGGTELEFRICNGGEKMTVSQIRCAWNEANNTQEPILGRDPDIG